MSDERAALWGLIYKGYNPKKLLKMLKVIVGEIEQDKDLQDQVKYYKEQS